MPDTSVVLCAYNEAETVADAIRSVSVQTIDPDRIELVVVDDASTDDTSDVVDACTSGAEYPTTVLRNDSNRGLALSANRGIDAATGTYVVRLDADDAFAPRALERLTETAESQGTDLVYSDRYELDSRTGAVDYVDVSHANLYSLVAAGTLMTRSRLSAIGGYREVFWEEYDLYVRYLTEDSDPAHVAEPLMVYLQHDASMTANEERVREGWAELADLWGVDTLREYGVLPPHVENDDAVNDSNR